MTTIQNCLNCEYDNGQCYECYILSGNEEKDIRKAIDRGYARKTDAIAEAKVLKRMGYETEVSRKLGKYYWRIEIVGGFNQ